MMKPDFFKASSKKERTHPKSQSEIAIATLFVSRRDTDVKPKQNSILEKEEENPAKRQDDEEK